MAASGRRRRCFGVMGGNVGVSSGIDEVLFRRLSPEQRWLRSGCVNERSSRDLERERERDGRRERETERASRYRLSVKC